MKYRKKPVIIEALQWNCDMLHIDEMIHFLGYSDDLKFTFENEYEIDTPTFKMKLWPDPEYTSFNNEVTLDIKTLEGLMHVSKGDYVIKGVEGEYYPCKPDIFEKTYEKVDEQ